MRMTSLGRRGVVLLLAATGCGLIDSDITKVTFDLPTKTYHFDTGMWGAVPANVPTVPCTDTAFCCMLINCGTMPVICENSVCTAEIPVSVRQTVNLGQEVPRLSGLTSVANISIESISYAIANNSLNIDLPAIELFLAPASVTDPTSGELLKFGTVPPTPAGTNPSGMVMLEPDAASKFAMFTDDLSSPFAFFAKAVVKVPSGSPTPSGAVDVSVTGTMSASL
jgi:hypothetical protein